MALSSAKVEKPGGRRWFLDLPSLYQELTTCETFSRTWRYRDQRHGPSLQMTHTLVEIQARKQPNTLQCGEFYSRIWGGGGGGGGGIRKHRKAPPPEVQKSLPTVGDIGGRFRGLKKGCQAGKIKVQAQGEGSLRRRERGEEHRARESVRWSRSGTRQA